MTLRIRPIAPHKASRAWKERDYYWQTLNGLPRSMGVHIERRNGNQLAYILFDHGQRIGEISNWIVAVKEAEYKTVLGKKFLSVPANDECTFVSPKPIDRKRAQLVVIQDGKQEFTLEIKAVKGATFVTARIVSQKTLSKN